jgi:hypothetical protein
MRINELEPVFVDDNFDLYDIKEYGKLYINSTHFALLCPCGGYAINRDGKELNMDVPIVLSHTPNETPNWQLTNNNGLVTINPSIRTIGHCGSHYFIRENKIIWC